MKNFIKITLFGVVSILIILLATYFILLNENQATSDEMVIMKIAPEPIIMSSNEREIETAEEPDEYEILADKYIEKMKELEITTDKEQWFVEYKELIEENSDLLDPPENIYDYFTEEELDLFFRVVQAEVGDEYSFEQKCHVASVILNRVEHEDFPNNLLDVLRQKKQFVTISNNKYKKVTVSNTTILACEYSFEIKNTAKGALFFDSNNVLKYKKIFHDGAHQFYIYH